MRNMLHGKIHRATVTDSNLDYEGSITIDPDLLDAADMLPHEMTHVCDVNNGERFVTYIIEGKRGSGEIIVNGAAARKVAVGDKVIVLTFSLVEEAQARSHVSRLVYVDQQNRIVRRVP